MRALGRKGGLAGGPARARALPPARRSAIARKAAHARWSKRVLAPGARLDLVTLVAHVGSSVARVPPPRDLEQQVVRAIAASRRDPALARMLPVFLWRMREHLQLAKLVTLAKRRHEAPALGFFLETAGKLGGSRVFRGALTRLRAHRDASPPSYFFHGTQTRPFARLVTDRATPPLARRWGLLMNMPWESFASYFNRVRKL